MLGWRGRPGDRYLLGFYDLAGDVTVDGRHDLPVFVNLPVIVANATDLFAEAATAMGILRFGVTDVRRLTSTTRPLLGLRISLLFVGTIKLLLILCTITVLLATMALRNLITFVMGDDVFAMATLVLSGPDSILKVLATDLLAVPT